MKSNQIKRGHPGSYLLVLIFLLIAFRSYMNIKAFFIETSHNAWDYVNLGLTAMVLIALMIALVKFVMIRWEIHPDGRDVSLTRNRHVLFQGNVDDLKLLGYDFGMLRLATSEGTIFIFPAYGMMKRFIRPNE